MKYYTYHLTTHNSLLNFSFREVSCKGVNWFSLAQALSGGIFL